MKMCSFVDIGSSSHYQTSCWKRQRGPCTIRQAEGQGMEAKEEDGERKEGIGKERNQTRREQEQGA